MTKRTRLFVLGASAILVIGIGTAGVASYVSLEKIGLVGNGSGDLAFIPSATRIVAYANIRHLMDSDLGRMLQPDLVPGAEAGPESKSNGAPSQLLAETGINIETDVDSVTAAWLEGGSASHEDMPLLLLRRDFRRA